jgi:hypothetical protein
MHMLFLAVEEASDFPLWHGAFLKFQEHMFIGLYVIKGELTRRRGEVCHPT